MSLSSRALLLQPKVIADMDNAEIARRAANLRSLLLAAGEDDDGFSVMLDNYCNLMIADVARMAGSETTPASADAEDAARFRWMLPHLRVDWCGEYSEIGIVDGLPDIELETEDVREAIDHAMRPGERDSR